MTNITNTLTLEQVTRNMLRAEKAIARYNKEYNYDITKAPASIQENYNNLLMAWDEFKTHRDVLKAAA